MAQAQAPDDKYSIYDFSAGPTETGLRVGHWNVRGLGLASDATKKINYVKCLINRHCFHIFAVAETMLRDSIRKTRTDIEGFRCERLDRKMKGDGSREKASGGIMVYIHQGLKYVNIAANELKGNLQYIILRVSKPVKDDIVVIYNPPNDSHVARFTSYLDILAANRNVLRYPVVVLGDINIDQLNLTKYPKTHVDAMKNALKRLNMEQQFNRITRLRPADWSGAILDHIYTTNLILIRECDVMRINVSDHDIVYCVLSGTEMKPDIKQRHDSYEKSLEQFASKKNSDIEVRILFYQAREWAGLAKEYARKVDELRSRLKALSL